MKKSTLTLLLMSAATTGMFSSCAYMQTHKNIKEAAHTYRGCELKADNISLHRKGSQWFISAPAGIYSKSFPTIHDDIFDKNDNDPIYRPINNADGRCFYPISAGTAASLQRTDGYAQITGLVAEINNQSQSGTSSLTGAATYPIRAEIVNADKPAVLVDSRSPQKTPVGYRIASGVDMCTVDAVGTVVYNVAIPLMAPFRFFWEFCNDK